MTKERAAILAPIIAAYSEGKQIQYQLNVWHAWEDIDNPGFVDHPANYRIKPEVPVAREWDAWVHDGGYLGGSLYPMTGKEGWSPIRVREILTESES